MSYLRIFRLLFVIFSLFLVADTLSTWDGFRFYAPFSEFLPAIALVTILGVFGIIIITAIFWLPVKIYSSICRRMKWDEWATPLIIIYSAACLQAMSSIDYKQSVMNYLAVIAVVFIAVWLLRKNEIRMRSPIKADTIHEKISPLVIIFGLWFLVSLPIVAYHTWIKQDEKTIPTQESARTIALQHNRPNIILVTFDTLTARDMSLYGSGRENTPFITEFAKGSSRFDRNQAETNFTTPATVSLMTGKRIWTHQVYHLHGSKPIKIEEENLPLLLKQNGYYNIAFIVNIHSTVDVLGVKKYFDIAPYPTEFARPTNILFNQQFGVIEQFIDREFSPIRLHFRWYKAKYMPIYYIRMAYMRVANILTNELKETDVPPEIAFNKFLQMLDSDMPEPFFAWIHLLPPHALYLPPEPFAGMFDDTLEKKEDKKERFHDEQRARYDEFIAYCDSEFGEFLDGLDKRKMLDKSIVILSSDHGESFQHNYYGHSGPHLYEQVTHVPLVIKEPYQKEGKIIENLVEGIDLPATILEMAGINVPPWMEGRSLVPLMRGEELPPIPIFSMTFQTNQSRGHEISKGTVSVWDEDYKLIHYLDENKSLLFNVRNDPEEEKDLFDEEKETAGRLLNLINKNLSKANERIKNEKCCPDL